MKSVLGKLIQQKFGYEQYAVYTEKLNKKESMDIFFDIYDKLHDQSSESLNDSLRDLLTSVQVSIQISRNFFYVSLGYVVSILMLLGLDLIQYVFFTALGLITLCYTYKLWEFIRNRYCDRDVRIVLIYKIVLFYLLEENCLQNESNEV